MNAGGIAHGEKAPMVTNHETGDNHGERAGNVQRGSGAIAAQNEGEGDEDFDLVVVDGAEGGSSPRGREHRPRGCRHRLPKGRV